MIHAVLQRVRLFRIALMLAAYAGSMLASVAYPPPTTWKGVTYSPRRHTFFRMLYDWDLYDSTAGKHVYTMADEDLTRLSQNGFNLLHVYIWDRELLQSVNSSEPAGFETVPSNSANGQWDNLKDFVAMAESKGLYVAIHFADGRVLRRLSEMGGNPMMTPEIAATEFANWAGLFIHHLTPAHNNIVMWGVSFALGPAPGDPNNNYSKTWAKCSKKVADIVAARTPSTTGVLGLVAANLAFELLDASSNVHDNTSILPRGAGYVWGWEMAQRRVKTMRDALTVEYGYTKDPDIYMLQLYNANSADLRTSLNSLLGGTVSGGLAPSLSKLFVVEFATSSSLQSALFNSVNDSKGNDVPSWGDAQVPTTTVAGQAQWLNNTLCAFNGVGFQKMAYWSMYDPYAMWTGSPWLQTGQTLSWNGFWGLIYEGESYGDKPSWSTLRNFYANGSLSCPITQNSSVPILAILATSNYYTSAQPIRLYWNVGDNVSLAANSGHGSSFSCSDNQTTALSTSSLVGSCGFTDINPNYSIGPRTVSLTATSGAGGSQAANVSLTIGDAPQLNAVTNSNYSMTVASNDVAIFWGNGLSRSGGNTVQLVRSGYPDVWLFDGDGHYFFDESHFQINSSLAGRASPGVWTVYLRSPYSGTPSAAFSLTIVP
jgi:hypothetical protein